VRQPGDHAPGIHAQVGQARSPELDIFVRVITPALGDVQEYVFRRHASAQPAGQLISEGLANLEPGLTFGDSQVHVGDAHAASCAVERATGACVRITVDEHGAGQGVTMVNADDMAAACRTREDFSTMFKGSSQDIAKQRIDCIGCLVGDPVACAGHHVEAAFG